MKEKKRMMKSGKPKVRMEMCTTWRTKNQLMPIHRVESDQFSTFEKKTIKEIQNPFVLFRVSEERHKIKKERKRTQRNGT